MRRSYDAKAWQWFSLGKTQLSSLHAMVAQRTTDADSPTAFAGGQIHVGSVSHRVTSHDPAAVLRFQQPACTASTRIFLCQQSGVPAQPHLLFAFLHALLWHQLRQPLSSTLTGLPTACQPSFNPLRQVVEGHALKPVPSMKTSCTRLIISCCCFCRCPSLRCFGWEIKSG